MNYKLYEIRVIKSIPMISFIRGIFARNMVEAEELFDLDILSGSEYFITVSK